MVKDKRFVPIPVAIISLLIIVPVVFAALFFMILPSRPGCVQIMVKTTDGRPAVGLNLVIVINATGQKIVEGFTGPGGRITFCDVFQPNTEYLVRVKDKYGNVLWEEFFTTNEKSTASVPPIIVH